MYKFKNVLHWLQIYALQEHSPLILIIPRQKLVLSYERFSRNKTFTYATLMAGFVKLLLISMIYTQCEVGRGSSVGTARGPG
jgi:hypothetical protein